MDLSILWVEDLACLRFLSMPKDRIDCCWFCLRFTLFQKDNPAIDYDSINVLLLEFAGALFQLAFIYRLEDSSGANSSLFSTISILVSKIFWLQCTKVPKLLQCKLISLKKYIVDLNAIPCLPIIPLWISPNVFVHVIFTHWIICCPFLFDCCG